MNSRIRRPLYISLKVLIMLLLAPYGRSAATKTSKEYVKKTKKQLS